MADEIARLGFAIDTGALTGAKAAADRAATSFDNMGVAAEKAASKAQQAAGGTKKLGDAAAKAGKEAEGTRQGLRGMLENLTTLHPQLAASGDKISSISQQVGGLSQQLGAGGAGGLNGTLTQSVGIFGSLARGLGPIGGLVAGLAGGLAALSAAGAGIVTVTGMMQDKYALLEARLKNVYHSASAARTVFADILELSRKNGVANEQTAESFLRLARNNEAIGLTRKEMVDLADAVQELGRVSGASTGELASGMLQFSQALASGRLNGDELRSIMENMPALAKAIADGMGVSVGQMRALGAEGQLTGDKITAAILSQLPKIREEFDALPQTSEQAFTRVSNAWDKLLADMGKTLDSSGILQGFAKGTEAVINRIDKALEPESLSDRIQRLREQSRSGGLSFNLGFPFPTILPKPQSVINRQLTAAEDELRRQSEKNRRDAEQSIFEQFKTVNKAPYNQAARVFEEVDPARKKVQEITANIESLQRVTEAYSKHPELFAPKEVETIARAGAYIDSLKKKMEDALGPFEKFVKVTSDRQKDAARYGFGGGLSFGAEVEKLVGTITSSGTSVSRETAVQGVIASRVQQIKEQTSALNDQIEAEQRRTASIGRGREAEIEATASAKALELQLRLVGKVSSDELTSAVETYRQKLIDLSHAQDENAGTASRLNAEFDVSVQKQLDAARATGANVGQLAELEKQLRRLRELSLAAPSAVPGLTSGYEAKDLQQRRQEADRIRQLADQADLNARLAGAASPADRRRIEQNEQARRFAEGFSPAQQEAAQQAKLNQLRSQDALTVANLLEDRRQAAALTQKEIEATRLGGLAAQVQIARERELNAIKASGLALTQAEVAERLKLAEQAVIDQDRLAKERRAADAYVNLWTEAGRNVTSNLEDQFSRMLDGQGADLKDFLGSLAKDLSMTLFRATVTQPLQNIFSDIGTGSLGNGPTGGGGLGSLFSGIGSKIKGLFSSGSSAPVANDNAPVTSGAVSAIYGSAAAKAATGLTANAGTFEQVGNFVARNPSMVDPRLLDILKTTAIKGGYNVQAFSGYRPGDTGFHGGGLATDINLLDANGNVIPNYQDASTFSTYERFAQESRMYQMQKYPELADKYRWGGYFSGGKGTYGALDEMHFDLGGGDGRGMLGGSWSGGLTSKQRGLWPGISSRGLDEISGDFTDKMKAANTNVAEAIPKTFEPPLKDVATNFAKDIDIKPVQDLTPAINNVASASSQAVPSLGGLSSGIGSLFNSLFSGIGSLFGFANGGVISGGRTVRAYGYGGIVSKPRIFPMADGMGLVGEAGAEAILPLKRGADGKLGVQSNGQQGGGGNVSVIINDMRGQGAPVETEHTTSADGDRLIRLTIRDQVRQQMNDGTFDRPMRDTYGAQRVLARR